MYDCIPQPMECAPLPKKIEILRFFYPRYVGHSSNVCRLYIVEELRHDFFDSIFFFVSSDAGLFGSNWNVVVGFFFCRPV